MIHIYRMTRYADVDQILFQASEETYQEFRRRFPVSIRPAKKGFEGGYHTFLREEYRNHFFDPIKAYFREKYVLPKVQLSAFRGTQCLSDRWSAQVWQDKVSEAIQTYFMKEGFSVQTDKNAGLVEVIPQKVSLTQENVEVYWSVAYRIQMLENRRPLLWCHDRFRLLLDGKAASLEQIAKAHGEGSSVLLKIRQFTTRSAEEQFGVLQRFARRIPALSACEDLCFETEPIAAQELGMDTWFWLHDSNACFELSNGLQTNLAQAMLGEGCGLYTQPDDLQVILLMPDPDSSQVVPLIDWEKVVSDVEHFLKQTMPDVKVPFIVLNYPMVGDFDTCLKNFQQATQSNSERRVLCLMVTPGPEFRFSSNVDQIAAEQQSFHINRALKEHTRGGFTATVDWNKLQDSKDRPYTLHNAIFSSLYRLNATPWKIANLTYDVKPRESNYFLGIYGGIADLRSMAATLIDYEGGLVAFGGKSFEDDREKAGSFEEEIEKLISSILSKGIHQTKPTPKHIIFHIPIDFLTYGQFIQEILSTQSVTSDILAIQQSNVRFYQSSNQQGTPSHGIAVGSTELKTAYLMNTLSVGEKTERGYIFPNPNTSMLRQISGTSSIQSLSAQVFWLSNAHINALHRTVDLPITIAYARALHDHIRKTRKSLRITQNYRKTLYWL